MESSKYITKHLDRLILDPNNYRFIDSPNYKKISEGEIADSRIQTRTYNILVGKNNENIRDLITSFKANGVLKLDPIQVKEVSDGKYAVIEGNRRTAALKYLYQEFKTGNDVGKLTQESFRSVDLVQTIGESPVQHLITMGLHHISGKRKWSPVNQAQLIFDLRTLHDQSEEDIMESLSITKQSLRRALRTLSLINTYKNSDFGDQFEAMQYSIFEEIIKTQSIKNWLGWDDSNFTCTKISHRDKLFSWISRAETDSTSDEELSLENETLDPIITKSHEIRELGRFIDDSSAVAKMEASRSVTKGFVLSEAVGEQKFKNAIENLTKDVSVAFQFSEHIEEKDLRTIATLRDKIDSLIPSSRAFIEKSEIIPIDPLNSHVSTHFSSVTIESYGRLNNIILTNLSKINIIAGSNNVGKTSLLEALYIATQLNHLGSFIEQERYRGKFYKGFKSYWLNRNFLGSAKIKAIFNEQEITSKISRNNDALSSDKAHYLTSISAECSVKGEEFSSVTHLFDNREQEEFYERRRTLCRASFTSPFRYNDDQLAKAYDAALLGKYLEDVVSFITEKIDPNIVNVDMSSDKRFLVSSSQFDQAVDITKFGEGLQRVFEIALLMGYSRDGILCIDEIDAAIHRGLLINFALFVQELATRFNVQVFFSTHSKECIDAFAQNRIPGVDLTAQVLTLEDKSIVCRHISGEKLVQLIESIDLDIR